MADSCSVFRIAGHLEKWPWGVIEGSLDQEALCVEVDLGKT